MDYNPQNKIKNHECQKKKRNFSQNTCSVMKVGEDGVSICYFFFFFNTLFCHLNSLHQLWRDTGRVPACRMQQGTPSYQSLTFPL